MDSADTISNMSALFEQWGSYWIVPTGMLALYYYGRFHFNTPDYALSLKDEDGQPLVEAGRLISLAPPIYTTSRARFNRYAWRYVLLLQATFLAILFLPSIISDVGRILTLKFPTAPSTESLQYRALFALFALTGLLSSFPILKDLDGWVLNKLHQAAFIPHDAQRLAELLRDTDFIPSAATRAAVEEQLSKRDTLAVSAEISLGTLESKLLKVLWLRNELIQLVKQQQYLAFRRKLERDLDDIAASLANLKPSLIAYFDTQEELVTYDTVHVSAPINIDAYINANLTNPQVKELSARRQQLYKMSSAIYYRMCLVMSLLVYATKSVPDHMGETLKKVGFQIGITATPAWDWNTIAKILMSIFSALLLINLAVIFSIFLWGIDNEWSRTVTRSTMLADAAVDTVPFAIVLLIAIRLKRYWRLNQQPLGRAENLMVAVCSFAAAAFYYFVLGYALSRSITVVAPLLLAVTPCAAGGFAGWYIDRSMERLPPSLGIGFLQAACQGFATSLGIFFLIPEYHWAQTTYLVSYAGFESAVVGLIVGLLFQHLYQRTDFTSESIVADLALQPPVLSSA